jgi:hypothetical protein
MKKIFLLMFFALSFTIGHVVAQKQLYFGLQGGGMNTWITNQNNYGLPDKYPDMDYKTTFGGAFHVNIGFDFNKNIGLLLQVGYGKLGQRFTDLINDTTFTRNIKLNYLQIPLMFKYRSNGEVARFYVMAGPQFDFLLSAKQTYYKNDASLTDEVYNPKTMKPVKIGESTITDRYTSYDIFARLDMGVDISIMKNMFMNAGLTFCYGLTDINSTDWRDPFNSGKYNPSHNIALGFNVGINYCLDFSKGK